MANHTRVDLHRQRSRQARLLRKLLSYATSTMSLFVLVVIMIIVGGFLFEHIEGPPQRKRQAQAVEEFNQCKSRLLDQNEELSNEHIKTRRNLKKIIRLIKSIEAKPGRSRDQPGSVQLYKNRSRTLEDEFRLLSNVASQILYVDMKDDLYNEDDLIRNSRSASSESVIPTKARQSNADNFSEILDLLVQVALDKSQNGLLVNPLYGKTNQTVLWTLPSAVLYSVTVITTIGYGNIVPVTDEGKIATMIYAMFGIPLMLMFLTNLGSVLAMILKMAFKRIYRSCHCHYRRRNHLTNKTQHRVNSCQSCSSTNSKNLKSVCNTDGGMLLDKNLNLLSSRSTNLVKITEQSINISDFQDGDCLNNSNKNKIDEFNQSNFIEKRLNFTISIKTEDFNSNLKRKINQLELPIYVSLLIFLVYILFGSLAISHWEDWNFLDSCYFVFITFTTIGFGDLVPGFVNCQWKDQTRPLICAIYLLLGLALLSMCFQLMQDRIKSNAKRVGKQIGLIKSQLDLAKSSS